MKLRDMLITSAALGLAFCSAHAKVAGYWDGGLKYSYPFIQDAVNAAPTGSVIMLSSDAFHEHVVVSNKNLTFEGGYDNFLDRRPGGYTAVNGQGTGRPMTFHGSTCRVDLVHLVNGGGGWFNSHGGGALVKEASFVIFSNCGISSNVSAWAGGGLYIDRTSRALLNGATFVEDNKAEDLYGGAFFGGAYGGGTFVEGLLTLLGDGVWVRNNMTINGHGGGIWVAGGSLRISGSHVGLNNALTGVTATITYGGGIGALDAEVEIGDEADIQLNYAGRGGGIAMSGSTGYLAQADGTGHPQQDEVLISNNDATDVGGGLYATNCRIFLHEAVFLCNKADAGSGGAFLVDSSIRADEYPSYFCNNWGNLSAGGLGLFNSTAELCRTVFGPSHYAFTSGNTAAGPGGGLYALNSSVSAAGCTFEGNVASNGATYVGIGGALYAVDSYLFVTNHESFYDPNGPYGWEETWPSLFRSNRAEYASAAVSAAGGTTRVHKTAFIRNVSSNGIIGIAQGSFAAQDCAIAENACGDSGAALDAGDSPDCAVERCTLYDNGPAAIGIHGVSANLFVSDSIVWGHGAGAIANGGVTMVNSSDIEGGFTGTGNIDTNPCLYANYHLKPWSPCIDAGQLASPGEVDIDGEPRTGKRDLGFDECVDADKDNLADVLETGTGTWRSDIDTGAYTNNPDSDGDGMLDGDEWAADTDPTDPKHSLEFVKCWKRGSAPYARWVGGTRATQELQWSPSATGGWETVLIHHPPTSATNEHFIERGTPSAVVRVRAYR